MGHETSIGGRGRFFTPTLWTVVLRARGHSREALEELIRAYWKPIYVYVRRWGAATEEAKDLTQGFFMKLLERESLRGVSPEKGRFRTFLLTVLKHYLINEAERARAQKRRGGKPELSLDYARAEREYSGLPASNETPESSFNRHWALEVMSRALEALGREMDRATFKALKPHLAGGGPASTKTAAELGITSTALNNLIHRTRRRYRELLQIEVAGCVDDPGLVGDELKNLLNAVKA
jgi:RNA polymerase sigma factor (sigma-70 family)